MRVRPKTTFAEMIPTERLHNVPYKQWKTLYAVQ